MAKILLAEDDVNLREIFEMRLKAEGFEVLTAGDGEEALVVATKEHPDLIVVDVMMPKISGFEMLETLRANPQTAGIKAIMMTALGQAEDRDRGQKLGVLKYLVKSQVTLEDFVRSVHQILDQNQSNDKQQRSTMDPNNQAQDNNQPMTPATPPADASMAPPPAASTDGAEPAAQEKAEVESQVQDFANSPAPDPASGASMPSSVPPAPAGGAQADGMADPSATTSVPSDPMSTPPAAEPAAEPSATSGAADSSPTGTGSMGSESEQSAPGTTVEPTAPEHPQQ